MRCLRRSAFVGWNVQLLANHAKQVSKQQNFASYLTQATVLALQRYRFDSANVLSRDFAFPFKTMDDFLNGFPQAALILFLLHTVIIVKARAAFNCRQVQPQHKWIFGDSANETRHISDKSGQSAGHCASKTLVSGEISPPLASVVISICCGAENESPGEPACVRHRTPTVDWEDGFLQRSVCVRCCLHDLDMRRPLLRCHPPRLRMQCELADTV